MLWFFEAAFMVSCLLVLNYLTVSQSRLPGLNLTFSAMEFYFLVES